MSPIKPLPLAIEESLAPKSCTARMVVFAPTLSVLTQVVSSVLLCRSFV